MSYLTDNQISEMASAALTSYEMVADKQAAVRAAREHAIDEFGITPRKSAVLLALKIALARWEGIKMATRREMGA